MSSIKTIHESLQKLDVLFLGVPHVYFDRTGNLPIWGIVHMFLTGTYNSSFEFMNSKQLSENNNILKFTVQISCTLSSKIHSISRFQFNELRMAARAYNMGKSSYSTKTSMYMEKTNELLGELYTKTVRVDPVTRKSTPFPKKFTDQFSTNKNPTFVMPDIPEMPQNAYHTTVLTRFSDMDSNFHVTTFRYFMFFTDCATEAAISGYYTHFTLDMCWYPVLKFDVEFLGESKAGDKLTICTWQDESDVQKIYFSCFNDNKCVMKALFVYGQERMDVKLPPYKL